MTVAASNRKPVPAPRKKTRDLVPDESSDSYLVIDRAARDGRKVSTRDMSEAEVRDLLIGDRKGE